MSLTKAEAREIAEQSLRAFAKFVCPQMQYGAVHEAVFDWLQQGKPDANQLLLLPRGHLKSHMMAAWCAWWITKHPETTILYISATADLAEDQLYAIKNILTSDKYRHYWPEMIHPDEGKRQRWTVSEISVDHPKRKKEGTRDPTVRAVGLTSNTTGKHADVIVADDVVVPDNAYTEEGRNKVTRAMSQISSIKNPGGYVKACGTTYHPKDIYSIWRTQQVPVIDKEGQVQGERPLWDLFERVVEKDGVFLWPRTFRGDGKAYGFDHQILAQIKVEYIDVAQFFAQYYLDPNDPGTQRISYDRFSYYDPVHLKKNLGRWYFKNKPLNVYAAVDFAYSRSRAADYSAIVVIGMDEDGFIYVLDIHRYKTDKIDTHLQHVMEVISKWDVSRLRAETNAGQVLIVNDLKARMAREGLVIPIDAIHRTGKDGTKEERMSSILEPRYEQGLILHFKGGHTPALEDEIVQSRPAHDDIKDALASVIEIAKAPRKARELKQNNVVYHSRFGGVAYRS